MQAHTLMTLLLIATVPVAHAHGDRHAPAAQTAEQTDWGIAGKARAVTRTISIDIGDDMRFRPDDIRVDQGDTVRFVLRNKGRMLHEMVIGTAEELARHAALMAKFPNMEHDAPYMVHVNPGKAGETVWHFNRAGRFEFACLIPGHYEAGMRGHITVNPKPGKTQ